MSDLGKPRSSGGPRLDRSKHLVSRVLLGLMVVVSIVTVVPSGLSQSISQLRPLPPPGQLRVHAAQRVASAVVSNLLDYTEAHQLATSTSDHVVALARHQAIWDRPHEDLLAIALQPNQSVQSLRRRWRLRERELLALNPDLNLMEVLPGEELVVWRFDPDHRARSRYRPNRGRLINGELMPEGDGWVVANQERAFGTVQLIDALIHGVRVTMAEHPGGQDLLVADISRIEGGALRPHRSHHSGRDVDVTYFERTTDPPTFSRTRPDELDEKRTWTFLRTLITQHDTVYVFMHRRLQIRLYEYAESIGEHPAWLSSLFQYGPRRHRNHRAIIRTSPGHHDHMHIRFGCTPHDIRCREAR